MIALLASLPARLERRLTGYLPDTVRSSVRIEMASYAFYGLFFGSSIGFLPVVLRRLGASSEQLAFYIAQTYTGSLLALLSLFVLTRTNPRTALLGCWLLSRGSLLVAPLIDGPALLLVMTAFFWFWEMLPAPAYARLMQQVYPLNYRGRAMAAVRFVMVLTMLIAAPLAGWALDRFGYKPIFFLAGLAGLISVLMLSRLRIHGVEGPEAQLPSLSGLAAVLRSNRPFLVYLLGFIVFGIGGLLGTPLYPLIQIDRLGLSYTVIGALAFCQSCCWLIGAYYWGRLIDRKGGLWVMQLNVALSALIPLNYIVAGQGWMLIPAFAVQGLIMTGSELGMINANIQLASRGQVAEHSALQSTVMGLRGIATPFLATAMLAAGVPTGVILLLGALLLGLGWYIFGRVQVDRG